MKIEPLILDILKRCIIAGESVELPDGKLPRPIYEQVNKVLECLGGKWNRSAKAHLFDGDPADVLELAIMTGEVTDAKKEFQFFETPEKLVRTMIDLAEIRDGMTILEPSAGRGAILAWLVNGYPSSPIYFSEIQKESVTFIREKISDEAICIEFDFLAAKPGKIFGGIQFDRIVMNPPFTKGQDIAHVEHAFKFLKPGGILVAITAPGWTFRQDSRHTAFRNWIDEIDADIIDLPAGTFAESGTMIATKLITILK